MYIQIINIYLRLGFSHCVSEVRDAADDMIEPNIFDYYLFQLQKFYPEQKIIFYRSFHIPFLPFSPLQLFVRKIPSNLIDISTGC